MILKTLQPVELGQGIQLCFCMINDNSKPYYWNTLNLILLPSMIKYLLLTWSTVETWRLTSILLSPYKHTQFNDIKDRLLQILTNTQPDQWKCYDYSTMKMYNWMMGNEKAHIVFQWLCKCATGLRYKFYFRLLLHDRINTRNLLGRKSMLLESYNCVLCNEKAKETALHLFWDCTFVQSLLQLAFPISQAKETGLWRTSKEIFVDIIILGRWNLWNQRSGKIF